MDPFAKSDLRRLIEIQGMPAASIYMPTHRTGREIREDALRCKNLLKQAGERLQNRGLRSSETRDLLEPAWTLQADGEFWKNQSDGLAIFVAAGHFYRYRVPLPFEEAVFVQERFHVKPLLPMMEGDGQFYLLAASQNQIRLFRGTHYSISELTPESLPKNLREALNIDEYTQHLNLFAYRPAGIPAGGQGDVVMFHGQGGSGGEVHKKDEIRQFFRRLDRGLQEFFSGSRSPLVFAGVDYLFPLFRDASSYASIVDEPVLGNPDELKPQALHAKAWEVVYPRFHRKREQAWNQYEQQAGTGLASDQVETVAMAARQGAVDTLFVVRGQPIWGTVDEQTGKITRHEQRQSGDEELLDHVAMHTVLNSGMVYTLQPHEVRNGSPLAAVFRHPVAPAAGRNS